MKKSILRPNLSGFQEFSTSHGKNNLLHIKRFLMLFMVGALKQ